MLGDRDLEALLNRVAAGKEPPVLGPDLVQSAALLRHIAHGLRLANVACASGLLIGLLIWPERVIAAPVVVKLAVLVWAIVSAWSTWMIRKRFRRLMREHLDREDYAVCPRCGYSLRGLPEEYRCPECSVFYERRGVAREWREWAGR